jgi:hypothetical protein
MQNYSDIQKFLHDFVLSKKHLASSSHFVTLHVKGGVSQLKVFVFLGQQIRYDPELSILSKFGRVDG